MFLTAPLLILFFVVAFFEYYLLPQKYRWILLVACNYLFYVFFWQANCVFLLTLILADFCIARLMGHQRKKWKKRFLLILGLVINLLPFLFYKYNNFFLGIVQSISQMYHCPVIFSRGLMTSPIGMSFFTLQSMGYLFDVYTEKIKPEKHLGIFAAFLSFFPQILSGPIERAGHMLPQLHEKKPFEQAQILDGLKLIFFGFCKKMFIADTLSPYVNEVFSQPTLYTGLPLLIGVAMFSVQLYCDFSGYTDIAIGMARIFGFELNPNFKQPFASQSISDFWRRWHLSLSFWFRDYVYIPLGGNRVALTRQCLNVLVVFFLSGLWHGAAWTFAIWGLIHGTLIALSLLLRPLNARILLFAELYASAAVIRAVRVLRTYLFLCLAWIFFRAQSVSDAFYIVTHLLNGLWMQLHPVVFRNTLDMLLITPAFFVFFLLTLAALFLFHVHESWDIRGRIFRLPAAFQWALTYVLIFLFFFVAAGNATFLYAQF